MLILTHSHVFLIIIYIISTNVCVIWREEKREGKRCRETERGGRGVKAEAEEGRNWT